MNAWELQRFRYSFPFDSPTIYFRPTFGWPLSLSWKQPFNKICGTSDAMINATYRLEFIRLDPNFLLNRIKSLLSGTVFTQSIGLKEGLIFWSRVNLIWIRSCPSFNKGKEANINRRWDGCMPFPKALSWSDTETVSSTFGIRVGDSISLDDNCNFKHTSLLIVSPVNQMT